MPESANTEHYGSRRANPHSTVLNRPVRPRLRKTGMGLQSAVRIRTGQRQRRASESGRGRTGTAG